MIDEKTIRDVRALRYIINDKPHLVTSSVGEWLQIAYRVKAGSNRSPVTFMRAVWMFAKAAYREIC